jgi:hypothetical protein
MAAVLLLATMYIVIKIRSTKKKKKCSYYILLCPCFSLEASVRLSYPRETSSPWSTYRKFYCETVCGQSHPNFIYCDVYNSLPTPLLRVSWVASDPAASFLLVTFLLTRLDHKASSLNYGPQRGKRVPAYWWTYITYKMFSSPYTIPPAFFCRRL